MISRINEIDSITDDMLMDTTLRGAVEGFTHTLKDKVGGEMYKKLRIVGAFLVQGMSLDESAILALMHPDTLKKLLEEHPEVRAFVTFKLTSYKAKLLRTITNSAVMSGGDKVAGWLLERKFGEEFGAKKVADQGEDSRKHLLDEGLRHVREAGDSVPLIQSSKK
jgi:hypothetical protein